MAARHLPSIAVRPPRTLDARPIAGALLVLASFLAVLVGNQQLRTTTTVLAITRTLPQGALLRRGDLEPAPVHLTGAAAAAAVPAADLERVLGQRLAVATYPGELLIHQQLQPSLPLAAGQQTFTLTIPADTAASGDIQAGAAVAVLYAPQNAQSPQDGQLLLPRVRVLQVTTTGGNATLRDATGASGTGQTVLTLAVSSAQARALVVAKNSGHVDVSLLPPEPA